MSNTQSGTAAATATTGGTVAGRSASLAGDAWRELRRKPSFIAGLLLLLLVGSMAAFPSLWTSREANEQCNARMAKTGPESLNPFSGSEHPFGFDVSGCDYWAQMVHGARAPIVIGITVTLVALLLSVLLGSLSGYYGGWLDMLISRITDIAFGLPFILGALVVLTAFPEHDIWAIVLVLSAMMWTTMTRLMRGQVIAAKDQDYVHAAKMLGASDLRVIFRHILPNAIAPVFIYATLNIALAISAASVLDFLGVGLDYPSLSWGVQLADAQAEFLEHPYLMVYPAIFLSLTLLSFLMLGDAVRDAFDPKLR
ncbi:ABC transporter permease [Streptomyces sp. A7024]|uniref:ABC transporter permease n=1 Tax=Streptomyces coryli TaxID=1128680 RepID=A0A6G4U122_9ACTN|nr:ABC transporter permease [Streptomyces coryli]NGN65692.1 ABC transporter permease [Streptomyces coryli]